MMTESTPPINHLLLTRFNCRFAASWTSVALDPNWLGPRFELFERYCLPTVQSQTNNKFQWLIFFDDETPEPFRSRAESICSDCAKVVYVGQLTGELIRQTIADHCGDDEPLVATTRLDNDDGISRDFIARIQASFRNQAEPYYLNYPEGLILASDRLYQRRDPNNAFVTLVEPKENLVGVWAHPHTQIASHAPVFQIDGEPGWLQVVHGSNVSNKIRGRRIPRNHASLDRFAGNHQSAGKEAALTVRLENLLAMPLRESRDGLAKLKRWLRPQKI